jgi:hypothetical protein
MRLKLAQAGEGGGARPPPFSKNMYPVIQSVQRNGKVTCSFLDVFQVWRFFLLTLCSNISNSEHYRRVRVHCNRPLIYISLRNLALVFFKSECSEHKNL